MNTPEESEVVQHKQLVNRADIERDNNDVTKKFEEATTVEAVKESININGINFIDKNVIKWYNIKSGLSKKQPKERLATAHRKILKRKLKLQKEAELKAKAEEIKY